MNISKASVKIDPHWISAFLERTKQLLRSNWKLIVIPGVIVFIVFFAIYSVKDALPFAPQKLTQDPLASAKLPFFYGIISNLGIMLWASAAAINFTGAVLLHREPRKARFLLASGLFVIWLALDDLLMFHETVFPEYLHISEFAVYLGYVLIIIAYLLYFLSDIYTFTDYTLLVIALAAFASSILIDQFWGFAFGEDGAKFLGILFWMMYYFRTVTMLLSERMVAASETKQIAR